MPTGNPRPERTAVPTDFPAYEPKMELRCKACGKKGQYQVGRILIDPERTPGPKEKSPPYEEVVSFTGYFHCRHCGAGGPWELTTTAKIQITALLLEAVSDPSRARVQLGRPHLFDGTVTHCATEGEAHLKKLLEANPQDDFVWDRLGNLYRGADQHDLAFAAFQKAVEVNPRNVEAHYSLAGYLMDQGQMKRAAEHFEQVLRHCQEARSNQPGLLHDIVLDTLKSLQELHHESKGNIAFPPRFAPSAPAKAEINPRDIAPFEMDLETDEGWETLTSVYLTGKVPEAVRARAAQRLLLNRNQLSPARGQQRVGRNDKCPCGSGRKFKHCCGRAR